MSTITRRSRRIAVAALPAALLLLIAACSDDSSANADAATVPTASNVVKVTLGENADAMTMTLDPSSASAGSVTFEVTNVGQREHEFVVLKTDLGVADLPFDEAADEVIEDAPELTAIDEIEGIAAGETKTLTVDLESGHYVLICNIERHYRLGMRADFNVS